MRKLFLYLSFLLPAQMGAGIIEHRAQHTMQAMGKTVYFFGEEHTDPFDEDAIAQREELAYSFDAIMQENPKPLSVYLECDSNMQKRLEQHSYSYINNLCNQGSFFEQWYVPCAYAGGKEIRKNQLYLSSFDIRDATYAQFEHDLNRLVEGKISRNQIDFNALRRWGSKTVDTTLNDLFAHMQSRYPKKMMSHIKRDMERKKKSFYSMIDKQTQSKKRARYTYRALDSFYSYTDLLADFTILNKVASDPRQTIVVHAGAAHTENLSRYLNII